MKQDEVQLLVYAALLTPPGVLIFGRMLARIRESGGRVIFEKFGIPDFFMAFFLAAFFAINALGAAGNTTTPELPAPAPASTSLKAEDVLSSSVISFVMLAIIFGFLMIRKLSPTELFGLRKVGVLKAGVLGGLLIAALFPFLMVVTLIMQVLLRGQAKEQDVVQFFREAAGANQIPSIAAMFFMAVVVAPIFEEIVFRGYLYAVFKKWAGPAASLIFTAALFAALHVSVTVLPSLLVLAIALTIAYEWSGSLLVPIAMHASFNAIQLITLLGSIHHQGAS